MDANNSRIKKIALAILPALAVILFGIMQLNQSGAFDEGREGRSSSIEASADSNVEASLMSAVVFAGDAQAQSQLLLDATPIYRAFIGEALKEELSAIDDLRELGVYLVSERQSIKFEGFRVSNDGRRAEVRLKERWESTIYYVESNACFGRVPAFDAPQTNFLEKGPDGWKVYSIVFDNQTLPDLESC